jgi:MoxR-like ATPase
LFVNENYQALRAELSKVIYGQDEVIDFALAALFSCGHIILEGPPGVAKTLTVRTLAATLNLSYRRIQMTPDLLPTDITGSSIFREDTRTFEFHRGPIFTSFVLADEINRSSARTQSALLEAMQELQVTYDGVSYPLPEPFIVFATQNPIEQEGTYPLPLAQLDRFMFKVIVKYPPAEDERRVLKEHHATSGMSSPERFMVNKIMTPERILETRNLIRQTHVRDEVIDYVQRLVAATRDHDSLAVGASPRAGLMLLTGAKSMAWFAGRDFVIPDDVKTALLPAMRHRLVLSPTAELEGVSTDHVLYEILEAVEVPR